MSINLASGFPRQTEASWRDAAQAAEKGAPLEKLRTPTEDGFWLEPLYLEAPPGTDERPGVAPYTRGDTASGSGLYRVWHIRQPFRDADLNATNQAILRDLDRGVTEVLLVSDAATRRGLDPDAEEAAGLAGQGGLPWASVDDLDLVLAGVMEELAPIALEGGVAAFAQAILLLGLWRRRGRDLTAIEGSLGVSPVSAWAREGSMPGGVDRALVHAADLAAWCAEHAPRVRAVRADEGPFFEAGASDALGLGLMLAEAASLLRAFHQAGHPLRTGVGQFELSVRLGPDLFAGIAKLRAIRALWSRLVEALGVAEPAPRPALVASLGHRFLTRYDPWTNILRGTSATAAAAMGGARSFTLEPFDSGQGIPDELGRRMARNTQLILQEESHLAKVTDPGGGSWYLEHRTQALASEAWKVLQAVEAEGGLPEALRRGWVQDRVQEARAAREGAIDRRKRPITGVSEFPDPQERAIERPIRSSDEVARKASDRLELCRKRDAGEGLAGRPTEGALALALGGATLGRLQTALLADAPSETVTPLVPIRLAEGFERLRDAVRAAQPPPVHLANIGPIARHTARATFVQNLVGVAGFSASHGPPTTDPAEAAAAFRASGAQVAVLCGADADYAQHGEAFARALAEAEAKQVLLAGRPGDLEDRLTAAGVSGHLALGMNVRAALSDLLEVHGVQPSEEDHR